MPFLRQFGWLELVVILVIVLLIFGPSKLPKLAQSIGKAIREFRQNLTGDKDEGEEPSMDEPE